MYVCMYVYMHACMRAFMHACMYVFQRLICVTEAPELCLCGPGNVHVCMYV